VGWTYKTLIHWWSLITPVNMRFGGD